jgi:hypothetical protein
MAGRHPAQDVLADLAAEVLEEHQARVIEAHVIGCARCADLLADAERVRQLLLSGDPGPMPAHVWDRIAGALTAEAVAAAGPPPSASVEPLAPAKPAGPQTTAHPQNWITQEWPADAGWVPEPESDQAVDAPTGQWERFMDHSFDAVVEDRPADADHLIAAPVRVDEPSTRGEAHPFGRGSERPMRRSSAMRSRRDVRAERHSHAVVRYAKPLGIAAGIIAVAGLAGLAVVKLPLGGGANSSTAAGSAAAAADQAGPAEGAFAAAVMATGTDYTKANIAQKIRQLTQLDGEARVRAAAPTPKAAEASASSASSAAPPVPAPIGATAAEASALSRSQPVPSNAPLAAPKRLAECLAELEAPGQNPIAVDLARFDGREAAIIVLAGRNGGYEVWAVSRNCGAGASGLISFTSVPPS